MTTKASNVLIKLVHGSKKRVVKITIFVGHIFGDSKSHLSGCFRLFSPKTVDSNVVGMQKHLA